MCRRAELESRNRQSETESYSVETLTVSVCESYLECRGVIEIIAQPYIIGNIGTNRQYMRRRTGNSQRIPDTGTDLEFVCHEVAEFGSDSDVGGSGRNALDKICGYSYSQHTADILVALVLSRNSQCKHRQKRQSANDKFLHSFKI